MDGVGNVVEDAPAKLANSILLFCKGLGWLTSVNLPGVERRSSTDSEVRIKPNYFKKQCFFITIFLPKVIIEVQSGNRVLNWLVPCI